jgi:anti-sigma regulatory factor (Ser/Thr protein kinase)
VSRPKRLIPVPAGPHPDVPLRVAALPQFEAVEIREFSIERTGQCARYARAAVREALAEWGLLDLLDEVELMASEAVTNAYLHAKSENPIGLRLHRVTRGVLVVVDDADPTPIPAPSLPDRPEGDEHRRGVFLALAQAADYGQDLQTDGKHLWAQFAAA